MNIVFGIRLYHKSSHHGRLCIEFRRIHFLQVRWSINSPLGQGVLDIQVGPRLDWAEVGVLVRPLGNEVWILHSLFFQVLIHKHLIVLVEGLGHELLHLSHLFFSVVKSILLVVLPLDWEPWRSVQFIFALHFCN